MNRPLHKEAQDASKNSSSHAGLWFDRFFNEYDDSWEVKPASKLKWIDGIAGFVGDRAQLQTFAKSQEELLAALDGQLLVMQSDWHFVTGLGNKHPVENGFAWHPTLGVPYLTGAAVKGLLRAWCEVWAGFDKARLLLWFGDTEQAGALIFFDAVPTGPVKLKADIMTPHYGDWYAKGGEKPKTDGSNAPADWHDPVPVPFLVVDKGQSFRFSFASRTGNDIDLAEVEKELMEALQWLGAGAKTAAGYGRMQRNEKEEIRIRKEVEGGRAQAEKEARQSSMSPLERELDGWSSSPENLAEQEANGWLDRMEKEPPEEGERIALALKAFFEKTGRWSKPSKKQKDKNQRVKRILERGDV